MVSIKDVKIGHLLISQNLKVHCVTQIQINIACPDKSIITGVNKNQEQHSATPDKWFSLLDPSIDISKVD